MDITVTREPSVLSAAPSAPPGESLLPRNLEDIFALVRSLDADQKKALFAELDVSSEGELYDSIMNVPFYEQTLMSYPESQINKTLLLYIPPIILLFGTIGNILSFLILIRRPMRRHPTYNFLAVLSVTDILVLYVGLLRIWIEELTGYDVQNQFDWSCALITLLGYTVSDYSVWLIIAVTVERYIAVSRPLRASTLCNQRKAVRIMLVILLVLVLINLHYLWTTGVRPKKLGSGMVCQGKAGYEKIVNVIWPWVDAFIYSYLPFVIISVINGLIIYKVYLSKRARRAMSSGQEARRNVAVTKRGAGGAAAPSHHHPQESSTRLTIMLLSISFTFLITTLPLNSMLIANEFMGRHKDPRRYSRLKLIRTITELLMYLNHSTNFFLYCATGRKFRLQLLALFCPGRYRQQHSQYVPQWQSDNTQQGADTRHHPRVTGTTACSSVVRSKTPLRPLLHHTQPG